MTTDEIARKSGLTTWYLHKDELVAGLTYRKERNIMPLAGQVWLIELTTGADKAEIVAELLNGEPVKDLDVAAKS